MESPTSELETKHDTVNQTVWAAYSVKFQELTRWDTYMECILGCGAGGAIYLVFLMAVVFWVRSSFMLIFLAWPALIILGFLVGAMLGTLASLLVLPANASLGWPLKSLWFSFIVGGLSGFLPFCLLLLNARDSTNPDLLFVAAVGPFPHMLLGHLCAYWLTEKAVTEHNQRFGVIKHKVDQADLRTTRFGITHIMILTIWAAIGFSIISFATPEFRMLLAKSFPPLQIAAGLMAIVVIKLVSCVSSYRKRNVSVPNH